MARFAVIKIIFMVLFSILSSAAMAETLGWGATLANGTVIMLTGISANITIMGDYEVDGLEVYDSYLLLNVSSAPLYVSLPYSYSNGVLNITSLADSTQSLYINSNIPDSTPCLAGEQCLSGHCVHGFCRPTIAHCGDSYCDIRESCLPDCGFGDCDYGFNLTYPKTMATKVNETSIFEVSIKNTGTCSIIPVIFAVSGLPEDWIEIEPNSSGYLNNRNPFMFNLSVTPLTEGEYSVNLMFEGGISKNYFSVLTAVRGDAYGCACPQATGWSDCANGTRERTVYSCDGSSCLATLETEQCGDINYEPFLAVAALAILSGICLKRKKTLNKFFKS